MPFKSLPQNIQDIYTYNPTKAKQLLSEAGFPNGFKTSILAIQSQVDVSSLIATQLASNGVEARVEVAEAAARSAKLSSGDFDIYVYMTGGSIFDEDQEFTIVHSTTPVNPFEQNLTPTSTIPVYYRIGPSGYWRKKTATSYPLYENAGTRISYNSFTTSWATTTAVNYGFSSYLDFCHRKHQRTHNRYFGPEGRHDFVKRPGQ